jgi:hypothetical protein
MTEVLAKMNSFAPFKTAQQGSLLEPCPITAAVNELASGGTEARGAVFTKVEVVEFILNLCGYTQGRPLAEMRLLEPSFGDGDFLLPAVKRLLEAWVGAGRPDPVASLSHSILAVEIHRQSFNATRDRVCRVLMEAGIDAQSTEKLAARWLVNSDFLLLGLDGTFDFVVGNPPYVRQELIPTALIDEYRARYETIFDRADIYVPFFERSLSLLRPGGHLGFICADRWMKNRYGALLRKLIAEQFHLKIFVDMVDTPAFHSSVIAYPAITVISNERAEQTRIAYRPEISTSNLRALAEQLLAKGSVFPNGPVQEIEKVVVGAAPWIFDTSSQLDLVRRLERDFPAIEEAGCRVGIGVATGADKAFISQYDEMDVEPDRKLPLVMTRDILSGQVEWRGFGVINPFESTGGLVDLESYPRLRNYLEARKEQIARRHVAQKAPANWFRTIDRIHADLAVKPKLLIPDIKGSAHVVYENGRLYPHHNLYFIVSDSWDLRALQAVLLSGVARLFVAAYSTKMRGGYLRFQAQYLRRIRIPSWKTVSGSTQSALIEAAAIGDVEACNRATFDLFGLSKAEQVALGGVDADGN